MKGEVLKKSAICKKFEAETGWVFRKRSPYPDIDRIHNNWICPDSESLMRYDLEYFKEFSKYLITKLKEAPNDKD